MPLPRAPRSTLRNLLIALVWLHAGLAMAGPLGATSLVRTGPPPEPTHPVLAAKAVAKPSPAAAVVKTLAGPLVPAVRAAFGHKVHYKVEAYIDSVHVEANGAQIYRSSRPHSVGASPGLAGDRAAPEFVGGRVFKIANPAASQAGYAAYVERGIQVVVDLRAEATDVDRAAAQKAGLEYVNVKLHDNAIYNPMDTLIAGVNAANGAVRQGKSVVLHCEKGMGRTGLVTAGIALTKHPEWTEADVLKYAEDRGLELIGQKRALQRLFRAMLAGDIVETADGLAVADGRGARLLDGYPERPGVSRASQVRRTTGSLWNVEAERPYRKTDPRGIMEAMSAAASRSESNVMQPLSDGNRILEWPLVGNTEIGKAARELIESAEHEVFIETMIFADSALVRDVRAAVQTLARTRPQVKVFVRVSPRAPPFERHAASKAMVEKLLDSPNVVVGTFDPRAEGDPVTGMLGLNVSHSKTIVADNRRALVTDANLESNGDAKVANDQGRNWFQTALVFEGPAAAAIREQSAHGWQKVAQKGIELPAPPAPHTGFADGVPILTLGQAAGAGRDNAAHQAFLAGFKAAASRAAERRLAGQTAGERILVMTPNLNDKEVFASLADATEHLPVYVLLSKGYMDIEQALPGQGGNNERTVAALAKAAKDPSRLHIRWFGTPTEKGTTPQPALGRGLDMSHAKPILVGDTVWLGSRNLDTQSATTSRELDIVVQSRDVSAKYYRMFRSVWQRSPVAFEANAAAGQGGEQELASAAQ
jgi:phosphatidylserine/phosphatidylglycerophosphate/cardiolipin synthase-like enzyme